ncbi:MAG TPA: hypothetical protein VGD08_06835 [Stellaceae bacterium]|jgi:hypothetical protein
MKKNPAPTLCLLEHEADLLQPRRGQPDLFGLRWRRCRLRPGGGRGRDKDDGTGEHAEAASHHAVSSSLFVLIKTVRPPGRSVDFAAGNSVRSIRARAILSISSARPDVPRPFAVTLN